MTAVKANEPTPIGELHLDESRRRHLAEMLGYIACIHHHIDPDRFDIDLEFLESVRERLAADDDTYETTLRLSARNLLALEIIVDAAGTYTHRGDAPLMDDVDVDDCDAMAQWLSKEYSRLFCATPARPH